jgi:hypothetical protein
MLKSRFLPILAGAAALGFGGLFASPAGAAPVPPDQFTFTSCHASTGCVAGATFGTVTLTQSGTSVLFDVVLSDSGRFVETGSADQQLFKFNDSSSTAAITNALTGMPANAVTGGLTGGTGSFNGDGTGNFGFGIACAVPANCNGGSTPAFQEITFTVTNSTLAQVEAGNNNGIIFVADIAIGGNGANTGPVDVSVVPAPVIGHGLLVLLAVGGVLFGGKLLEHSKRRSSLGTA